METWEWRHAGQAVVQIDDTDVTVCADGPCTDFPIPSRAIQPVGGLLFSSTTPPPPLLGRPLSDAGSLSLSFYKEKMRNMFSRREKVGQANELLVW